MGIKLQTAGQITLFVFFIGLMLMFFMSLAGDYYLTQFAFKNEKQGENRSYKLTDVQLEMTRMSMVLHWITLGTFIVYASVAIAIE